MTIYLVTRFWRSREGFGRSQVYGPFGAREEAEETAQRASERHRGHLVMLEPITAARKR